MALKLTQDGILFNNIVAPQTIGHAKYNYEKYKDKTTGQDITRNSTEISSPINKFINVIDIDWNGAEITSTAFPAMNTTNNVINTTGDLLSWIKEGIEEAAVSGRTSEVVRRSLWIN